MVGAACALSDIYTFGPTFRAENSQTARRKLHFLSFCFDWIFSSVISYARCRFNDSCTPGIDLAEFHMIEPEMAFCDLSENMANAEGFVKFVVERALKRCQVPYCLSIF